MDSSTIEYEYGGYLREILHKPDPAIQAKLAGVEFGPDDLMQWTLRDRKSDPEWARIPAHRKRSEDGVILEGFFQDVRRIDNLGPDDARFWVPLGTIGWQDDRFPVDTAKYPIVEVTYRCATENAEPAWVWFYPGGLHHNMLKNTQSWRTVAHRISYFDFPRQVENVVLRLYSAVRSSESVEIASVRFREMSPSEKEVCHKEEVRLQTLDEPKRYATLDAVMPLGVTMDAAVAKTQADILGLGADDYWRFVLADLTYHHHNCIGLRNADKLENGEYEELLRLCDRHAVRLSVHHSFDCGDSDQEKSHFVDTAIAPYRDNDSILSWELDDEAARGDLPELLRLQTLIEKADPNHPVAVNTPHPDALPLYAQLFPVVGTSYDSSHDAWEVSELVRQHVGLGKGQQFWFTGPAYTYGSGAPEWNSCSEMRLILNQAIANGVKGWFAHTYHNEPVWLRGSVERSLTGAFLAFSDLWEELGWLMYRYHAITPLLLAATHQRSPKQWFITSCTAHDHAQLPQGIPPNSLYRLAGEDFTLNCVVSNDIREMTSVNIAVPPQSLKGQDIYDLTDFVHSRRWQPMKREQHLEMFPGQMHIILVAKPQVAVHWRDVIARHLIDEDKRVLGLDVELAQTYGLDCTEVERLIGQSARETPLDGLDTIKKARDTVIDDMYNCVTLREARSGILAASAALCGCDGALCRLYGRGKGDKARELGQQVLPLARELAVMRLELHKGQGGKITTLCDELANKALRFLAGLREET